MYAIVDIAGQQVKVEKGQKILVHRLEEEKGSNVDFDNVLLITNGDKTAVGDPVISGAQVQATILDHVKGDKVFVFKKKRRKGYKKLNGHRQYLSLLEIQEIIEKGATPKKETKKAEKPAKKETEAKPKEEPVAEAPKAEAKKKATAEKKPAKPKAKAEKPAAKDAAAETKKAEKKEQPKKTASEKKAEEPEETSED